MSVADHSRFEELVSRQLDDALSESEAAELVTLLAEPQMTGRFLEMMRLNSEIAGLLAAPVPDAAMVELVRADIEKHVAGALPLGDPTTPITEWTQASIPPQPSVTAPRPTPLRRKSPIRTLAWAAMVLTFAGLAAFFFFNRRPTADVPIIAALQGEVRLVGSGGERGVTPGDLWRRNERLKVGDPKGAAKLRFPDGSQLDFGGNVVAVNESSKDAVRVRLDHGTVLAALKQQSAVHSFVFVTPEAEAIVVGTTLRLVVSGHSTRLEVTEGEVRLRRRHDGAEVAVRAGYYAVVSPNSPLVATPIHPDPHAVH